jgi:diguanylate cyclase (GGDEF)-like protein
MHQLLDTVQKMTNGRERPQLEIAMANSMLALSRAKQVSIYKFEEREGKPRVWISVLTTSAGTHLHDDGICAPEDFFTLSDFPAFTISRSSGLPHAEAGSVTLPIVLHNSRLYGFVEIKGAAPNTISNPNIFSVLAIFSNVLALLDYSEIDTLTGLLNRKTFDEYLSRILSSLFEGDETKLPTTNKPRRRRAPPADQGHWLGVVDIDHFKNVNDTFGHSIGDEVLLLIASMMRESFRGHDKLFRFGGEEFVILLKPTTDIDALGAFERFRTSVESRSFPLVGRVTISTGFARIRQGDQPSLIFDRADQALYWIKSNGRNQASNFEDLIASGALKVKESKTEFEFF